MRNEDQKLDFFISEKQGFLVISLQGDITKTTAIRLETCLKECGGVPAKYVVLNLHDMTHVEVGGIPAFVRFQKALRDKPADLRLCFVKSDLFKMLSDAGAVRPEELSENLVTALQSFVVKKPGTV